MPIADLDDEGITPAPSPSGQPRTKRFHRSTLPRPDPALIMRQMQAANLAFARLGSSDVARSFMNEPHETLGGRPIDIAGASPDGLRQVIDAIAAREGPRLSPLG